MSEEIRVHVLKKPGRKFLYMRYVDPLTGKDVTRSTGTHLKKEAERAAGKWEAELREGRYKSASRVTWKEFRERYESEKLLGMSDNYAAVMHATFEHFEKLGIERLSKVNTEAVSKFQARLRADQIKESTIRCYLKHLKAALNWAVKMNLLVEAPSIEMPKRGRAKSQMKGRPITGEEFERMLKKVPKVRPDDPEIWKRLLNGLWLSGLRLGEALILSWDDSAKFSIDLYGKHPRFRILAEGQKANRDELLPMTPDFAQWILETPAEARNGLVFPMPVKADAVSRIVSAIGEKAKVKVSDGKTATAHDLRRSFGTRWSNKVKPAYLQKLMRHADIKTTMDFYVSHDADDIAAELWRDHSIPSDSSLPINTSKATVSTE